MKRTNQAVLIWLLMGFGSQHARGWEFKNFRVRGRLQTRFEVEQQADDDGGWASTFRMKRARVDGRWDPADWARLVMEFEGAGVFDLNNQETASVDLRDAYGRLQIHRALRVHVGQFKKPFSRLKMESSWDLLLPVRGLLNRHAVTRTVHGGYGGRDIGVMLSGRFPELARLSYYLGVFSGPGFLDGAPESHKDFVGRIQVRPFKGLRVAVNASHKLYHDQGGATRTVNLFGADLRFRIAGFTLQLEGAYGDNVDAREVDYSDHKLWGFHAIAAYALPLGGDLVLTPAVMVEMFDPDDQADDGRALRIAGAVSLDITGLCRVILFAEGTTGDLRVRDLSRGGVDERSVPTRLMAQVNLVF